MVHPLKGSHHPWPTPQGALLRSPSSRAQRLCQLLGSLQPGRFVSSSSFIYSIIYSCSCGLVDIYFALRAIIQHCWDFHGSPVVKIPHLRDRGCGFHPWLGNEDPACCGAAKIIIIIQHCFIDFVAHSVPALATGSSHHWLWLLAGTSGWPRLILKFLAPS